MATDDRAERRRHVRVRPVPGLSPEVALLGTAGMAEVMEVIDISVSGLALRSLGGLSTMKPGAHARLKLGLGRFGVQVVEVVVRWATPDAVGVELVDAPTEVTRAAGRFVAELLERGAAS